MKRKYLSVISLILAAMMISGIFSSCGTLFEKPQEETGSHSEDSTGNSERNDGNTTATEGDDTTKSPQGGETSATQGGNSGVPEGSNTGAPEGSDTGVPEGSDTGAPEGSDTGAPEGSDTGVPEGSDTGAPEGSETNAPEGSETSTPEETDVIENLAVIQNANNLKNGVNAFFTDGKRGEFALVNQKMSLNYALSAGLKQQITSLVNTQGQPYITDTADVFVKLTDGTTLYASNSTKPATANLYRLGYYMYEARFEEQNFIGAYNTEGGKILPIDSLTTNQTRARANDDGSMQVTILNLPDDVNKVDPFVKLKNVSYSAADYPYVAITLKANIKRMRGLEIFLTTDTHSTAYAQNVNITPSDEYMTYIFPLHLTSWYQGTVTGFRLDFSSESETGDIYEIKEIKLLGGKTDNLPDKLGLNRSFYIYSDKLHHVIQLASANVATEGIASVGMETKIAKNTVAKVVAKDKNGTHYTFDGVDWESAEYVGFDIKDAGVFGYILPAGEKTDRLEVVDNGDYYVIVQSRTPEGNAIQPSGYWSEADGMYKHFEGVENNGNDLYMGQRLYTDETHDFSAFLKEAYIERNPLTSNSFVINKRASSYERLYECPDCHEISDVALSQCANCYSEADPIIHDNMYFMGYDALRGIYSFMVPSEGFNAPYFQYPNKYIDLSLAIKGDEYQRNIYFMAYSTSGCLECAVILDEEKMLLPIPVEVGKNFSEGSGERNLWNIDDNLYGESIVPLLIEPKSSQIYTMLNLYQNWGQFPLKQVSWIQFYAPYYHLSTGVTESNCIVPYYSCKNARGLGTLPDHRAMSAHLWSGQPQHTSGGSHRWLMYTDADKVYSASENTLDYIDSYGPVYADVYMDYISDDGKIKVSYTHMEFPQTDENRAYYEMKYEVLEDVSFKYFYKDFCFYDVGDNDSKGSYDKVGYLNESNEPTIVAAATGTESFKYTLGTECPYFSFFDMPDYNQNSTSAEGFTNLSFLIYNSDININGQPSDARFVIINENDRVRLSLDLEAVTLKKGDTITINAIVMPWGDEFLDYDVVGDKNVRDVRENTLLHPLTATAGENCEVLPSVFLPKVRSTNGKNATFTLTGGQNNVAVRVYGFSKLTVPVIQECVNGEWVDYRISSAYKPDRFGNAYYYDGYSVFYDEDGTFSYAFIVPMDYTDADGRTFRVSAEESFVEWPSKLPEIPEEEKNLPMNVFVDSAEIMASAKNQAGKMFGSINMSSDGTYVTLTSNEKVQEAYFTIWPGNGQKTVTGQYFVLKYRLPNDNNRKHRYFEIFTSTAGKISGFGISNALINDGEWHTLVIDFASFESSKFEANENDEYKVTSVRIDIFNEYYANGNSIDIAFFGISDSLEEIRGYEKVDSINVFTKGGAVTSYDKEGNEIETPTDNTASTTTPGFNFYVSSSSIKDSALSDDGHAGKTVSSEDGSYVTLHYDKDKGRLESYVTLFTGNRKPTGQYLIFKYRAQQQVGYIEFYCSTEKDGAASGLNFNLNSDNNYLFVADDQWHTVVIDLSKVLPDDVFKANASGEYIARFIRIDLFNFGSVKDENYSVDIAYLGFADNYEDAISHDENTWFYDGEKSINASTDEALTAPQLPDEPITDATSGVPGYNVYLNHETIYNTGRNTAWQPTVSLNSTEKFATFKNYVTSNKLEYQLESYFNFYSGSNKATGQFVVIKYRSNVQQGYITLWSSTQNASPASGSNFDLTEGNGLFIADNEWHIVVVDLSKLIGTFTPTEEGKYVATHLRVDFFNFGSPRNPEDTQAFVDVAYIGFCDDFTEIITSDTEVDELVFFDGKTYKYSTATGELTEAPPADPEPDPEPEPDTEFKGNHFNATTIIQAAQNSGGHVGDEELIESGNVARIFNCVDPGATEVARKESYFYLLSDNTAETGRYLVMKYRAKHQVGYMQIYASTESNSASDGGNSFSLTLEKELFVADNEWHVVIIDLNKVLANYKPDENGKYFAKHLRIDLFNFGSPRDESETAYVDIAYISLSNDLAGLITSDTSVSKVSFHDGSLKEYFTSTGELLEAPDFVLNAAALSGQTEGTGLDRTLASDGSYLSYTVKSGASDAYSYALCTSKGVNSPAAPTGQYIMIKYKTTYTGNWTVYLGANNGSDTASGSGDKFSLTQKSGTSGAIVSDGEWQYLIIDLASFYASAGMSGFKPEDGTTDTYVIDYLRLGFWPSASTPIDIAYIAMADSIAKLEAYGNMDSYTYVDTYNAGMTNQTVVLNSAE